VAYFDAGSAGVAHLRRHSRSNPGPAPYRAQVRKHVGDRADGHDADRRPQRLCRALLDEPILHGNPQKKAMLVPLNAAYAQVRDQLAAHPAQAAAVRPFSGFFSRMLVSFFVEAIEPQSADAASLGTAVRLAESIADVEYALATHEKFKRWFSKWLKWHIVISVFLYVLLAQHIWGAIHFGLRWFEPTASEYFNGNSQQHDASRNDRQSPRIQTADAIDEFNNSFARLFQTTWRPAAKINGISTTVFGYAKWARHVEQPCGVEAGEILRASGQFNS